MSEKAKIESRFETIFNHVNEGILIIGSDGKIILSNPKVHQLFGYEEDELVGIPVEILVPSEHALRHVDYRKSYVSHPVKRPMGKNMTLHGRNKDGVEFPVEISLSYYETGEDLYVIAFIIDIHERYEQQEEIKRVNAELKALNESLEKKVGERTLVIREALNELQISRDDLRIALENEKQLHEMKSRFISMASHEFRTPLSAIMSSVSLIGKYVETEDQEKRVKHIERVKNAVIGLTEILNDFLSIGQLEEGKVVARLSEHNLSVIVDEVIKEITPICKSGQTISFDNRNILLMKVDRQMIRNVMINLLSNAIKFSAENSSIKVVIVHTSDVMEIAVKDEGIGISEDDMDYLFERFFRGRNVSNIQGTGLGLNIVAKYLELMKGSIRVESQLNVGTTFFVTIPKNY